MHAWFPEPVIEVVSERSSTSSVPSAPRHLIQVGDNMFSEARPSATLNPYHLRDNIYKSVVSTLFEVAAKDDGSTIAVGRLECRKECPRDHHQPSFPDRLVRLSAPSHFIIAKEWKTQPSAKSKRRKSPVAIQPMPFSKQNKSPLEQERPNHLQCKSVNVSQWDSALEWSHRQDLEKRSLARLPALSKGRRQASLVKRRDVKVVVVGAGMAGLTAADGLLRNGFKNVVLLEASSRIGGRIHTVAYGDQPNEFVEMGVADLDHPDKWNRLLDLARADGLAIENDMQRGCKLDPACCAELKETLPREAYLYDKAIDEELQTLRSLRSKCGDKIHLSSRDYYRETRRRFEEYTPSFAYEATNTTIACNLSEAVARYCNDLQFHQGDSAGDSDAQRILLKGTPVSGSSVCFPYGLSSILRPLTRHFKTNTVQYGARVNRIDWSSFNVKHYRNGENMMVTVSCSDGRRFKAHHVISTMPLGFLKSQARSTFSPELPAWKTRAIEAMGFGAVCKIFVHYLSPIYPSGFDFLCPASRDKRKGGATKSSAIKEHPSMRFTAKSESSIVEVTCTNSEPEKMSKEELLKTLTEALEKKLKIKIATPVVKLRRTRWCSDPFYGGTHPYVMTSGSEEDIALLAQPVILRSRPFLQFAGDATYNSRFSLLHAARLSGLREVERLKDLYNDLYGFENVNH